MKISYTKGRTINRGNFESTRVDIGLEIECEPETQEAAFNQIKTWVNDKLSTEKGE